MSGLFVLTTMPVFAQKDMLDMVLVDDLLSMDLDDLLDVEVIVATKRKQKISEAPSIISVFTHDQIKNMAVVSLIDVIQFAPGIETSIGSDGHWRVSIRGERKDGNILFLIDGHRFNNFYDGRAMFDLPASFIERVEIIRGSGSALYGTNAVVGVINVITVKSQNNATTTVGSNHTYGVSVNKNLAAKSDTVQSLSAGYFSTDGANVIENASVTTTTAESPDFESNGSVKDGYFQVSYDNKKLAYSVFGINRNRGPWLGPSFNQGSDSKIEQTQILANLDYRFKINENWTISPKIYGDVVVFDTLNQDFTKNELTLNRQFPDGGFTKEEYTAVSLGAELQTSVSIGEHLNILAGVVYENQDMQDYDLSRDYQLAGLVPKGFFANHDNQVFDQIGKSRDVFAAYSQGEWRWNKLSLTIGVRYDDYSDFGDSLNPRFSVVYALSEQLQFKLLYAHAFRAPTFKELFDNTNSDIGRGVVGNANLDAETNKTAELGVEYRIKQFVIRANLFNNKTEDAIGIFDPGGGGSPIAGIANLGNVTSQGGELELILYLNQHFNLFANYSNYKSEFVWVNGSPFADTLLNKLLEQARTYQNSRGQKELLNQPRTRINVGVNARFKRWLGFVGLTYGGRSSQNNRIQVEAPVSLNTATIIKEYFQGTVSFSYKVGNAVSIRVAGNHLFGGKHSDPSDGSQLVAFDTNGMKQPGDTYTVTLDYPF